ncbi:MAG TPA: D-glycero-beta-D-manno-heptose-7-phosphate kinase [Candidatus Kryptobacter bacterium]|nr:D-glycero-beta-D-manno-heptose-7-phosphate kinase [Candidatus Kryptobacter bacterium]
MSGFKKERLKELFDRFQGKRVAVIGDLMLDKYIWGSVNRISPEAPVPILQVESESARLGGAANVANNIKALGAEPILFGIVGNDESGAKLRDILDEMQLSREGIVTDPDRPTTVKTRVIAHNQHVVRLDHEQRKEIGAKTVADVMKVLRSMGSKLDAILLEDYNKGMLTKDLLKEVIDFAKTIGTIVSVDPKQANFFEYRNVTVFKPNVKEAEGALGIPASTDEQAVAAARELLNRLECQNVLLTRAEKGMTLVEKSGASMHFPTKARQVADVSGAGDTVISTLTVALVAGATIAEAAAIANHAGGIVCGEVGIAPVDKERLFVEVLNDSHSLEFR